MTRKYIIVADDSIKGFDEGIAKLEREWGAEEIEPSEDCISRAYIEPIIEELENICVNGDEYILSLLSNIKNAPSVTPQQTRWVPVSERLPETDGVYNVTRRLFDKQIDMEPYLIADACYFDGSNTWHNDNRINHSRHILEDIIAWMPLPTKPYKESEE